MDPLPQYSSHAFIPYLPTSSPLSPTSTRSSTSSTSSKIVEDIPLIDILPPVSLLNTSSWTYCGPLLQADASTLPSSFHTWAQSTIAGPILPRLLPFLEFLQTFLSRAGAQHYWLTIRATKPTTEYDTVRWHTDDIFFDPPGEKDRFGSSQTQWTPNNKRRYWKLATTLLGPGTLFLKDGASARRIQRAAKQKECSKRGEHTCSSFRCLGCLDAVEAVRHTLAEQFMHEEVERPKYGDVAFFRLGDTEGAVHSEPACNIDRIFVNVVPGSEEELKSLMARWGLNYPRSWSFGVPVAFDNEAISALPASSRVAAARRQDVDVVAESPSTMSLNMREEYTEWLRKKGFLFGQVFGSGKRDCSLAP
ncbi:hypothetical protein BDV96DRAFT_578331 [Lophiotrema nucula]|uniref:Clavaminate synthase-like protein n=1 Tax=Lophiotrema nucula TaxID=690887 RepID=A0A6A5Z2U7_9PLEO|nr:hypothetical protein BDV96DRAFT_578331 [Lophiotrema nucula]